MVRLKNDNMGIVFIWVLADLEMSCKLYFWKCSDKIDPKIVYI